eukprot:scaffold7012_cov272-Skeletonema_marinoi.AAC.1
MKRARWERTRLRNREVDNTKRQNAARERKGETNTARDRDRKAIEVEVIMNVWKNTKTRVQAV